MSKVNGVKTGSEVSKLSSKELRSKNSSKETKKVAGSALSNAKGSTEQKKKK